MACRGTSSIVTFEQDVPVITFDVTSGGEPVRFHNYKPELHVVSTDGTYVEKFNLIVISAGVLAFDPSTEEGIEEFYARLAEFELDTGYSAQIYLKAVSPLEEGLGLYDIIDPYWIDYTPDPTEVPGWFFGEVRLDQTVLTTFPWIIREAFKLRGN